MVTWMRVADVTVLSVGALTFSSDPRFSVIHVPRWETAIPYKYVCSNIHIFNKEIYTLDNLSFQHTNVYYIFAELRKMLWPHP